jgi:hypothetical protein
VKSLSTPFAESVPFILGTPCIGTKC